MHIKIVAPISHENAFVEACTENDKKTTAQTNNAQFERHQTG